MVVGVTEGYRKSLEINGTGYRVAQKGTDLEFALGFSHPVVVPAPAGITFTVERPDAVPRRGHRQAAGRRGRREHPQDPPAGAVQGQGREVRRARSFGARPERRVRSERDCCSSARGGVGRPARRRRARRHFRVRKNVSGTAERPRLVVTRSLRHITAQVVDDTRRATRWPRRPASTRPCAVPRATRRPWRPRSARSSPSGPRRRVSARSSSTVAATGTRGGIASLADAAREAGLEF